MDACASTAAGHQPGRGGRPARRHRPATASSSSASGSPSAPRTAASRTACAQGVGQPGRRPRRRPYARPARRAAARWPPRRRLRPRGDAARSVGSRRCLVPAPQPQPGRPARAVRRCAATRARPPRPAAVAPTASASRSANSSRASLAEPGPPAGRRTPAAAAAAAASTSAESRRAAAPRSGHELAEHLAQFPDALPGERGQREHGGARLAVLAERHAVLVEQPPQIVQHLVGGLPGQPVHLVEDDERDLRVARPAAADSARAAPRPRTSPGRRPRSPRRPAPGSGPPARGAATAAESWSGRSTRTSPRSCLGLRGSAAAGAAAAAGCRAGRAGPPRRRVQLQAMGAAVVGRRSPVSEIGHPGERVEQRRLAAAGGARDGDDGVLPGQPAPRGRLVQYPARLGERPAVEPGAGQPDQLAQRVEPQPQRPAGVRAARPAGRASGTASPPSRRVRIRRSGPVHGARSARRPMTPVVRTRPARALGAPSARSCSASAVRPVQPAPGRLPVAPCLGPRRPAVGPRCGPCGQ